MTWKGWKPSTSIDHRSLSRGFPVPRENRSWLLSSDHVGWRASSPSAEEVSWPHAGAVRAHQEQLLQGVRPRCRAWSPASAGTDAQEGFRSSARTRSRRAWLHYAPVRPWRFLPRMIADGRRRGRVLRRQGPIQDHAASAGAQGSVKTRSPRSRAISEPSWLRVPEPDASTLSVWGQPWRSRRTGRLYASNLRTDVAYVVEPRLGRPWSSFDGASMSV